MNDIKNTFSPDGILDHIQVDVELIRKEREEPLGVMFFDLDDDIRVSGHPGWYKN